MRNILKVELGRHEMDTWYFSPFPPGACCWGFPKSEDTVEARLLRLFTQATSRKTDTLFYPSQSTPLAKSCFSASSR